MTHKHQMKRIGILYEYNYQPSDDSVPIAMSWWHDKCECGYERYYSRESLGEANPERKDRYKKLDEPYESAD